MSVGVLRHFSSVAQYLGKLGGDAVEVQLDARHSQRRGGQGGQEKLHLLARLSGESGDR